jgi:hypothetical protein
VDAIRAHPSTSSATTSNDTASTPMLNPPYPQAQS